MSINSKDELKTAIRQLEQRKVFEKESLIAGINDFRESIKPVNILKNSLHQISAEPSLGKKILAAGAAIGAGIVTKKILRHSSKKVIGNLAGTALKSIAAAVIAKSGEKFKGAVKNIFQKFSNRNASKKISAG